MYLMCVHRFATFVKSQLKYNVWINLWIYKGQRLLMNCITLLYWIICRDKNIRWIHDSSSTFVHTRRTMKVVSTAMVAPSLQEVENQTSVARQNRIVQAEYRFLSRFIRHPIKPLNTVDRRYAVQVRVKTPIDSPLTRLHFKHQARIDDDL